MNYNKQHELFHKHFVNIRRGVVVFESMGQEEAAT